MRLVSFRDGDGIRVGVRTDAGVIPTGFHGVVELLTAGERGLEHVRERAEYGEPIADPQLLAPIPRPSKMLFCGVNFPSHAEENPDAVMPSEPFFFSKLASAIVGPGAPIVLPAPETHGDYEVELAAVIGRPARAVERSQALRHVFGYTVVNDVSARDVQFTEAQITLGKNADSFCPMGPELVTADEIPDPGALELRAHVNGELRQRGSTADWIFPLDALIEFVTRTRAVSLHPGDLITTGTPAGVAAFRDPPPWLAPGDVVSVSVEHVGELRNPVVAGWA